MNREASRYDYARAHGLVQKHPERRPGGARHSDALAREAELWIADLYGLPYPKLLGRDGGCEFVLPPLERGDRACRLDIKWTPRDDGRLLFGIDMPKLSADAYALVTGADREHFVSRGFTWRHLLKAAGTYGKWSGGWVAEQSELRPLDLLMACHGIVRVTDNLSQR